MFELWDHQQEAVEKFLRVHRLYIHFDVGLGKTRTALACALTQPKVKDVLILAPLSAHPSWKKEISTIGFSKPYTILTYEKFLYNHPPKMDPQSTLVVFDEAHRLKNWTAKTTKKAYHTFKHHRYKLMLSGTIADQLWDVYGQFKVLLPEKLPISWTQWKELHFIVDAFGKPLKLKPYITKDDLFKPFIDHFITKRKEEVLDLPDYKIHHMDISGVDFYSKLGEEEVEKEIDKSHLLALTSFITAYRKAQLLKNKFNKTLELLKEHPKTIVFCFFRETVEYYKNLLQHQAYYITGDNKKDLELILKYHDKPVVSTFSLKEGVNLQTYNRIIFHTLPLAYRDFYQSLGRVHRAGQTKPVDVYILHIHNVEPSIDRAVFRILSKKQDVLKYLKEVSSWKNLGI